MGGMKAGRCSLFGARFISAKPRNGGLQALKTAGGERRGICHNRRSHVHMGNHRTELVFPSNRRQATGKTLSPNWLSRDSHYIVPQTQGLSSQVTRRYGAEGTIVLVYGHCSSFKRLESEEIQMRCRGGIHKSVVCVQYRRRKAWNRQ